MKAIYKCKNWGIGLFAALLLGFSSMVFAGHGFAQQITPAGVSVFIFDPHITKWAVYDENGQLLKTGQGSGGKNYCRDIRRPCRTAVGSFQVYAVKGKSCKSKKFPIGKGGAPMPYCYFFHGGFAIHGSHHVRTYNASHGCVRIYPSDAKWLQGVLYPGSKVIIRPY